MASSSLTTSTTTTIINFHSKLHHSSSHSLSLSSTSLHFHFGFHSPHRRISAFRVSLANPNPKFNFNKLQNYNTNNNDDNEDDDDDELDRRRRGRRTWKRRKKSDPKQRPWWYVEFEDDNEEDDDERGILVEVVDRLLVIKVFRSYGWFSPFILISLLLSTGPKAFLMAFSVFFGLSLLILAFQKLQERLAGSSKPQKTRKRSSKYGRRNDNFVEDEADQDDQQSKRNKKRDYQSGAARNNGSFYTNQNSNGASGNYFGGWDELVRDDKTQRVHRSSQDNGRPKIMEEEEENENEEEEKLSRSMQDGDLPLLLRLLVSIFPFLASWTNLL